MQALYLASAILKPIIGNIMNFIDQWNIMFIGNLILMFIFVQACLSLVHDSKQIAGSTERIGATLSEICNSLISAFRNLRKTDE